MATVAAASSTTGAASMHVDSTSVQMTTMTPSALDMTARVRFSQMAVHARVGHMLHIEGDLLREFPNVEDLINSAPFTQYKEWLQSNEIEQGEQSHLVGNGFKAYESLGLGVQRGVLASKYAVTPVVQAQCAEEHFNCAKVAAQSQISVWDVETVADNDFKFAAYKTVQNRNALREFRQRSSAALQELAARCSPLSLRIMRTTAQHIQRVAGQVPNKV